MSLSSALSAANSGLSAAARSAELVSSNVANALTPGYGRREINLGAAVIGGVGVGVQVTGVERVTDPIATGQRRFADAAFGEAQQYAHFFRGMESVLGTPDTPSSLTGRVAALEAALISATASPESEIQLSLAVNTAKDLALLVNSASATIQQSRVAADQRITGQVKTLNTSLTAIAELNDQIKGSVVSDGDPSGLMDQRQHLIDQISEMIPVREIAREDGRVALITNNGTILVDQHAAEFEFEPTPTIVPEMTLASGALSGITITGAQSLAGTAKQVIAGGSLGANFEIRDVVAIDAQEQLDAFAQNLIQRTSNPLVDATLNGGPGLFTDAGAGYDSNTHVGLASRLAVSSRVDEAQGGAAWRLRDGIGATAQSSTGNITNLSALSDSLDANLALSIGSVFQNASQIVSEMGTSRNQYETREAFVGAQVNVFREQEGRAGVDTDQEMQKLLAIEQSYAANAKLIEAIDQMMQSLLRI